MVLYVCSFIIYIIYNMQFYSPRAEAPELIAVNKLTSTYQGVRCSPLKPVSENVDPECVIKRTAL